MKRPNLFPRFRRTPWMAIAVLWMTPALMAAQPANQKKGFNANDVYQFNGVDSINTFNGNLTLAIPIGASYSVGGGLSYGLTLVSNANVWESVQHCHANSVGCQTVCPRFGGCQFPADEQMPNYMLPHRRANAGIGWTLSLGRLYQPEHPAMAEHSVWTYESPDGSDHSFEAGDTNAVSYTIDGTYLRMTRAVDPNNGSLYIRKIEFPNGDIHIFEDPVATAPLKAEDHWRLRRITNRFAGNYLDITYGPVPNTPDSWRWTLTDSHGRTHWVDFLRRTYNEDPGVSGVLDHTRMILSDVYLSVHGTSSKAHFQFLHEQVSLGRSPYHTDTFHLSENADFNKATVQTLSQIVLPDGTGYSFTYRNGSLLDANGVPITMTLPTGGMIDWAWETYYKPWSSADSGREYLRVSYGVRERKLYGRVPAGGGSRPLIGTWIYTPQNDCDPTRPEFFDDVCREFKTTITDPLGNKTVSYFSVSTDQFPVAPWDSTQYGLPFTKKTSDGTAAPNTRWLSTQILKPDGTALRSTYVRYSGEVEPSWQLTPQWHRKSERVVYEDDSASSMDTDWSDWDSYGHYRTQVTSGTIAGTPKITRTTHYLAPGTAWITSLYDYTSVTDDAGRTYRTDACFNLATGFLNRQHTRKDPYAAASPTVKAADVLAVFTPDSRGNVSQERYYGGDVNPTAARQASGGRLAGAAGSGDSCTGPVGTLVYQIDHTRVEPTAADDGSLVSKYASVDTPFTDVTIDRRSGLVSKSRDTAGVETAYAYDWAGRITQEAPTGRASTDYTYITPTSFEITVSKSMAGSSEPMPWSKYLIDPFGRVVRERTALPSGAESERNIVYNALGWRLSVSEPGDAGALTQFTYDPLGQVLQVTAPDGSLTDYSYMGSRQKTRTSRIWTGGPSDTTVDTTEYYDGYGRLRSVSEKSGATTATSRIGATVVTEYKYDVANHLTSVTMNRPSTGSGPMQQRLFDYDGRGFLRWESQPESGMSSYFYDARGHLMTKTQAGAETPFDLDYFYDAGERLIRVEGRNPLFGMTGEPRFRVLKSFAYGSANDGDNLTMGKLTQAVRHNYVQNTDYVVAHSYEYFDTAGRRTGRTTTIGEQTSLGWTQLQAIDMGQTYTPLDLPETVRYPMCEYCGAPDLDPWRYDALRTYDRGRLKSVGGFVSSITYWPNGLRKVLQHTNTVADTQTVGSMPRPTQIGFSTYDRCVQPLFAVQPASVHIATAGAAATLEVTVTGTPTIKYDWYEASLAATPVGSAPSITLHPLVTTTYYVSVANACGHAVSQPVKVTVGPCTPPATGPIVPVLQPDGSWILTPDPTAEASPTYAWTRLSDGAAMGTSRTLTVGALTQTTTYRLEITDACGYSTSQVTITVPLQITSTALTATTNPANTQVTVTWPAVTGATSYVVERRSGSGWAVAGSSTGTTFVDTAVLSARTYAYRVKAEGNGNSSSYSNSDVATTMTFTPVVAGDYVTSSSVVGLLLSVNKVRAAVGWPDVTWNNILAASDPLPGSDIPISSRHITACRARMNEALQALGVPVTSYSDGDVMDRPIQAQHINELQQRAK